MKLSFTRFAGLAALLLFVGYAFVTLQGPQGVPALIEKRRQIRDFEKKNADLARKIEEQRARIGRFSDTPTGPEKEIRQRLNLVKPDEKVFMLQDQAQPASQTAPAK